MRDNTPFLLFVGAAAALAVYVAWPSVGERIPRTVGRVLNMRLDPGASTEIDDRRGQGGGGEIDTGAMGGPPPWGPGRGGGARCWDDVEHRDVDMSFCDRERGGRR